MKIVGVRATPIRPPEQPAPSWLLDTAVASPMTIHPEYRANRSAWWPAYPELLVEIETDDGLVGYGAPAPGPTRGLIEGHLA